MWISRTIAAAVLLLLAAQRVQAQPAAQAADRDTTAVQSTEQGLPQDSTLVGSPGTVHPNAVPYATDRSGLYYILAAPSYALHWIVKPVGKTALWLKRKEVRRRLEDLVTNAAGTAGVYPLVQVGGRRTFAGGATLFHSDLFGGHAVRLGFVYAGPDDSESQFVYTAPRRERLPLLVRLTAGHTRDSEENYFLSPDLSLDEKGYYAIRRRRAGAEVGYLVRPNLLLSGTAGFQRVWIASIVPDRIGPGRPVPPEVAGFGAHSLVEGGARMTFDFRKGTARRQRRGLASLRTRWNLREAVLHAYGGGFADVGLSYVSEPGDARFRYLRYHAELQGFVPVPGLPQNRRLALRTRLEQRISLAGGEVPFIDESILGGAGNLRGFEQDRFRGLGALLVNLEYRFPVWDTWDGVLFLDGGQVFGEGADLAPDRFRWAVGTGLRVMSADRFLVRMEVAKSRETLRALLQFQPNF